MKRKAICFILGMLIISSPVLATGINVQINDGGITDKDGRSLRDSDYHPYQSKLEFFHNTLPAPNSSSGKLNVDTSTQYTKIGTLNKYQLSSLDGGTLYVRAWNGTVAPTSPGNNYYGKASHGVASGTTLPYDWTASISTVYKADVPFSPTIGSISESLVRTGDVFRLTLTIAISYNEAGAGNERREITGTSLEIVFPDGTRETRNGSSITLTDAPQGTYSFTPIATNWYGSTRGTTQTYTTLGMAGGGRVVFTYNLKRYDPAKLVVNSIAVPPNLKDDGGNAITKASQLAGLINGRAKRDLGIDRDIVLAIGKWDPTTGAAVSYWTREGGVDFDLEVGGGYQIYVSDDYTLTLQGTM